MAAKGGSGEPERKVRSPAVVLVRPQLAENVGAVARAMLNFGLADLRLVSPRGGWPPLPPHDDAMRRAAAGADAVLENARLHDITEAAVADLQVVLALTARRRDMIKPVLCVPQAAGRLRTAAAVGAATGLLFGPERSGLNNDDVTLADAMVHLPANAAFSSLNLAQAVAVAGYAWAAAEAAETAASAPGPLPAPRAELLGFYEHLEGALDVAGFLTPPEKRPAMVRNIRNLFQRAALTEQEVRTLRGIVAALRPGSAGGPPPGAVSQG